MAKRANSKKRQPRSRKTKKRLAAKFARVAARRKK